MRIISCLVMALVLSAAAPAWAANVLVPKCETGNCPSSTLGLIPPPAPKQSTPMMTLPQADSPKSANPAASVEPPAASQQPVKTSIAPGGTVSKEAAEQDKKMNEFMRAAGMAPQKPKPADNPALKKILDEEARAKIEPPLILDDTDFVEQPLGKEQEMLKILPNNLPIGVAAGYLWGANDVGRISEVLGYTPQQIPANCQLRLDGSVKTDKGMYRAAVYSGQRGTVRYDGKITEVRFVPRAVCNQPKGILPQTGGIIKRVGDKLSVQLTAEVKCGPAARPPLSVEVQYGGDGTATCRYN